MREACYAHRLDHRLRNAGLLAVQTRGGHRGNIAREARIDMLGQRHPRALEHQIHVIAQGRGRIGIDHFDMAVGPAEAAQLPEITLPAEIGRMRHDRIAEGPHFRP